jgi:hypothetical protein
VKIFLHWFQRSQPKPLTDWASEPAGQTWCKFTSYADIFLYWLINANPNPNPNTLHLTLALLLTLTLTMPHTRVEWAYYTWVFIHYIT